MDVIPTNNQPVPFTELVVLGGPDDLRGVRWGLYRDYSGALFTAEYRWPVWMWMDASLFTDAGGVFGPHWQNFSVQKLVPDVGFGVRIRTATSFVMRMQVAWSPADGWQFFVAATAVP
jgi:outer membrane protein assembly factor BamA